MIKSKFYLFAATLFVALSLPSCKDYDDQIADIENRLDLLEGKTLTSINQQIASINVSIQNLKDVDAE